VLGRFFDYHLLDMIELGVDKYTPMAAFKVRRAFARAGYGARGSDVWPAARKLWRVECIDGQVPHWIEALDGI